jgi:very-short-patch-repair endonuclease
MGDPTFARYLRRNMTGVERLLWSRLRRRQQGGFKFRRQVPLGPYVVDFACYAARVVVEVDGPGHERLGGPGCRARRLARGKGGSGSCASLQTTS